MPIPGDCPDRRVRPAAASASDCRHRREIPRCTSPSPIAAAADATDDAPNRTASRFGAAAQSGVLVAESSDAV